MAQFLRSRFFLKALIAAELPPVKPDPLAPPTALELYLSRQKAIVKELKLGRAPRTVERFFLEFGGSLKELFVQGIQAWGLFWVKRKELPLIAPNPTALPTLVQNDERTRISTG